MDKLILNASQMHTNRKESNGRKVEAPSNQG
ncbi:uncharacterized protein METZ01_LOCUS446698 [marine metagenome]|uniref:Uncharacterized protein n=1 Tax=marine metagenome TaxID=408172 RepID=A0A382ZE89_9ZZZZ